MAARKYLSAIFVETWTVSSLFFLVELIPWHITCLLGLQAQFANTQAGVGGHRALKDDLGKHVAVMVKKPHVTSTYVHSAHRRMAF